MSLIQTVAPTVEPVALDDLKHHLRISTATTIEDDLLNSYIKVARRQAENYTHRQICQATWQMSLTAFPSSRILLPRAPLMNSTAVNITYTDSSYNAQTVDSTFLSIDVSNSIPSVYPSYNSSNENAWADLTLATIPNVIKVTFQCGYTSAAPSSANTGVPDEIKQYIKIRCGSMYEYRETITIDQYRRIPKDFHVGLLDAYIIEDII